MGEAYKAKDTHFTNYIVTHFPAFLAKLDGLLVENGGKYLFGAKMTIADLFITGTFFLRTSHNPLFEHQLILRAMVRNVPRVSAWVDGIAAEFQDHLSKPENQSTF